MVLADALVYGLAALVLTAQSTAPSFKAEEQRRLNECLNKAVEDPTEAYEDGLVWLDEGNRPGARFCTATALIELGNYAEGADRLEALAQAPDGGTLGERAIYLAQAGNAWLLSGLPQEAVIALTDALTLDRFDPEVYKDRARAYLAQELWSEGEKDLDKSLELQPGDIEAYLLRAETRLRQNRLEQAMADVQQARAIDGENIEALLLRGRIRIAQFDAE